MSTPVYQPRSRVPRHAWAAVERARLTVVPRGSTTAPRVPFVTLLTLLLVGGIAGLLLFNTNMQQLSFVASSMEEQATVLAGKEETLRMQLHRMRDPQTLAAQARRMGMVPSTSPAFIRLTDGKVLGNPRAAEPTDAFRIDDLAPVRPRPKIVVAKRPAHRDTADRSGPASGERAQAGRRNGGDDAGRARGRTR